MTERLRKVLVEVTVVEEVWAGTPDAELAQVLDHEITTVSGYDGIVSITLPGSASSTGLAVAQSVDCPNCAAPAGQACFRLNAQQGTPARSVHKERLDRSQAAQR